MLIQRANEALHRGNHCDLKDSLVSREGAQKDDTGLSQVCGNIKRYFYISVRRHRLAGDTRDARRTSSTTRVLLEPNNQFVILRHIASIHDMLAGEHRNYMLIFKAC